MKEKTARPITINLLKRHDISLFDSIFNWALSVGRLLIIITQFIALGAFLFRFVLDRQIIDLNDVIQDKQTVVKFLEKDEKTYRSLQKRLEVIGKYQDDASEQVEMLTGMVDLARGKMELTSFSFTSTSVTIEGVTSSGSMLQQFISQLRTYPGIAAVSIDTIENLSEENRIRASISLSFKAPESETVLPVMPMMQIPAKL